MSIIASILAVQNISRKKRKRDRRHRKRLAQRRMLLWRRNRDFIAGHAREERHAALHQRGAQPST